MRLSGLDLELATGGVWNNGMPDMVGGIGTDSRHFTAGHAFLALRGSQFDGHRYAHKVIGRAVALIGDAEGVQLWDNLAVPQLQVTDTLIALGDIAHSWRLRLKGTTVIAISGSYGKTSVRSLLQHCFGRLGKSVAGTRANLNNLIGVPATLLTVPENCDVAIIECGISEIGEMARLGHIVRPDIAVLTGLTTAHGQGLGGMDGIVREKATLLAHLAPNGWCALGEGVQSKLVHAGLQLPDEALSQDDIHDNIVRWQLDGLKLDLIGDGERASLELPLPARHWAANMALCASIVRHWFLRHERTTLPLARIAEVLQEWQADAGRLRLMAGKNRSTILDDSYNANPASMQAALDTLKSMDGNRIAILGDMAELGAEAAALHAALNTTDIDELILIGPHMQHLARQHAHAVWFESTDAAVKGLQSRQLTTQDRVLVKASRSMRLENIVALFATGDEGHAV
ncbi:MAG TPA: UDP-N-acetylmuramoyl-tripeptide--D-alanyl-D-alanine ligase [Mariprofundaceae bacterium]|nr:UDP-N-acetylmuramoyl-tripeptide--D-alanyl-D-alanine ligase [Mariprofundaceae bacterium]